MAAGGPGWGVATLASALRAVATAGGGDAPAAECDPAVAALATALSSVAQRVSDYAEAGCSKGRSAGTVSAVLVDLLQQQQHAATSTPVSGSGSGSVASAWAPSLHDPSTTPSSPPGSGLACSGWSPSTQQLDAWARGLVRTLRRSHVERLMATCRLHTQVGFS